MLRPTVLPFSPRPLATAMLCLVAAQSAFSQTEAQTEPVDEILVWGQGSRFEESVTSPVSRLTPEDFAAINAVTTEDLVKFEPSLVIRRRFIGDANGTMGMRGANMFQTSRSMVFADGVPLHYFLQSRWNGSPRWTMISASEIAEIQVLYGPYSAEYSGNAMGGVVLIESAIPQQREFHFDSSVYAQQFDAYGFDDTLMGHKAFISWGDRIGDASVYVSYNRLENESQPQTFYHGATSSASDGQMVSGAVAGNDQFGQEQRWFGDTGTVDTTTENFKLKLGYDIGEWSTLLNLAYEDRHNSNLPNNYLRNTAGQSVWGGVVEQDGRRFSVPATRFARGEQQRDSLSVGLRMRGPLHPDVEVEANLNQFAILRDRSSSSRRHPQDPAHSQEGQVTDFGDTGWQSGELKFFVTPAGLPDLRLVTGLRYDAYELNIGVYDSLNYRRAERSGVRSRSGGETRIAAAYAQMNWQLHEQWDMSLGGRLEDFSSHRGYYSSGVGDGLQIVSVPGQSRSDLSPKFSFGYQPTADWQLRYSLARAYRYPIVEELFSQFQAFNNINEANPELKPEDGVHHNLMLSRSLPGGSVTFNLFQERIKDVIEAQASTLPGGMSVRTFIPIDEVETRGAEFIVNLDDLLLPGLNTRFNVSYTDNEILRNAVDPSIVGNVFPRMPRWRANLLTAYRVTDDWRVSANYQYASNSFGRNDNRDTARGVFGAQDGYSRLGLKTDYDLRNGFTVGAGIDNARNDVDYVAHPWPGRTYYLNLAYQFR